MKLPSINVMKANLVSVYEQATSAERQQGERWYSEAHNIMREWSKAYNVSAACAACVTAAISPQCDWSRNLIIADDILAGRNPSVGGALHLNIDKARALQDTIGNVRLGSDDIGAVMHGAFAHGPKVNAFARNLAGDTHAVTIDAHAAQAALGATAVSVVRENQYSAYVEAYRSLAADLEIAPCILQATIWLVWKRLYPRTTKQRLNRERRNNA